MREQVKRLEDEPDTSTAKPGALPVGQASYINAVEAVGARRRTVEAAEDVQKCRLARTGSPRHREPVARSNFEIDKTEGLDRWVRVVASAELLELDDRLRHH